MLPPAPDQAYAKCIEISRRVQWDIDRHVIRNRQLDFTRKFLPDSMSQVDRLDFLVPGELLLLSQVQGRTYLNMFGLLERVISAKLLELGRARGPEGHSAFEAMVRFADEAVKHQELFRRVEQLAAAGMCDWYRFLPKSNHVARFILGKSTWAVLALASIVHLTVQQHCRASVESAWQGSELFSEVLQFHWREEAQQAVVDELELRRIDNALGEAERDQCVTDLIDLIVAVDEVLQLQAWADADYFVSVAQRQFGAHERGRLREGVLRAYRWQYIASGAKHPRFGRLLSDLLSMAQAHRIGVTLAPIVDS